MSTVDTTQPGALAHQAPRYVATCAACGSRKACPDDVGRATAACGLRYLGWRRGADGLWRCPRCAGRGMAAARPDDHGGADQYL